MKHDVNLKFYNTETRQLEPFSPIEKGHARIYTCGPTVYHYAHIGNFRTYVFGDLLRRTLKFFGFKVTQVMNLTDIDDKTIKGAITKNISLSDYTQPYKDAFFEDLKTLHIEAAEHYPAATDFIPQMIDMVNALLDKGVAYKGGDGSVYYAIRKFPRYGCLSHLKLEDLQAGASERVANDEYDKENISDFVLWKHYDPSRDGKIFWDSPFGPGRPGWHLECSVMAVRLLGETIDIHGGGVDLIFPHHENEIAQSEACTGKKFAKLWMHAEHLLVDHKKMSKSLGNVYTLRDLLSKGYTAPQIRYILLQTHYRTQLNFTFAGLEGAKAALQRLGDFIQRLKSLQGDEASGKVDPLLRKTEEAFASALAQDLNISPALATLFDLIREINILCDAGEVSRKEGEAVLALLKRFDTVLGVLPLEEENEAIPFELEQALEKRQQARKTKNWTEADALRDFILAKGYLIEDGPTGARLKRMN